jgi:hypothetical protein
MGLQMNDIIEYDKLIDGFCETCAILSKKEACMDGLPTPPKNVLRWYVVLAGRDDYRCGNRLYNNCLGVFIKPVCEN